MSKDYSTTAESSRAISTNELISASRLIVESLVEDVAWTDAEIGFCKCPGHDLHTNRTGKKDCAIYLGISEQRAPTIYCTHDSCANAVASANHELRSRIGKLQYDPANKPTGEEVKRWRNEARQKRLERRKRELISKAWENQLPLIQDKFPWTLEDVVQDSPVDVLQLRRDGRPEWAHLIELIYKPEDLVFIGALTDTGPGHFKPAGEWLEVFGQAQGPRLADDKVFISPWVWRKGATSKAKENAIGRRALVLESDSLGEGVFPVFKWLRQAMKLKAIVYTGGKSFHAWFEPPPPEFREELKAIAPALQLDAAMFRNATTRLPGAVRPDTGRNQDLIFLGRRDA